MQRPIARCVALAVFVAALGGCSAVLHSDPQLEASDAPSSISEVSATAELYRTRSDPARGGIQLSVTNNGVDPLTVTRVVVDSAALATPIERDRTTVIPAGATRDLALLLPAPQCSSQAILPNAVLTVVLGPGARDEVRLRTTDRLGQWFEWHDRACFAEAAATQVDLELRRAPSLDDVEMGTIGAELIATAKGGEVTLVSIDDTVLFALVGDSTTSDRMPTLALDRGLAVGATTVVSVYLAAARCDPHAVAEDKQGTIFSVHLDLDGARGSTTVISDDATRAALYDAITQACRF